MRLFTLLLATLVTLSLASDVKRLQKSLLNAQKATRCTNKLQEKIDKTSHALAEARKCTFNNLPFAEFERLRTKCKQRSETRRELEKCEKNKKHCRKIRKELDAILEACKAIRWDGTRPKCPKIAPLKKKLAELEAKMCPAGGNATEITRELHEAANEEAKQMGLKIAPYKSIILEPTMGKADAVVIIMHGVFGMAEQMIPVAEGLRPHLPKTRFILPQANPDFVTFFNGTGPSWFDLLGNQVDSPQDEEGIIEAAANIDAIAQVQRRVFGIGEDKVAIYGVSQGAALAMTVYLRHVVSAMVAVSGFLPLVDSYPAALNMGSQSAPALLLHGTADETVPFFVGELSRDAIRAFGRMVEFVEFVGDGHDLTGRLGEIVAKGGQLYKKVFGKI